MSDDIGFKIYAVVDGLKASMSQASESVQKFSEKATKDVETLGKGFKALGELTEAYLAVLAVEKVEAFFEKFAQQATQISRLSIEFGIATDKVQGLQVAMQLGGGSGDQLQSLFSRLSVAMEKAIDKSGAQRTAFEQLGISTQFLKENANNLPAVMDRFADAIQQAGGGAKITAELIPLLGRGGAAIVKPLSEGSEGLKEMQKAAEDTGGTMNELEQNQFEGMHKSIVLMNESFNGLGITLATAFGPAIQAIIDGITEFVSALNGGSEHISIFRDVLILIVAPIDTVIAALSLFKVVMVTIWQTAMIVADGVYNEFHAMFQYIDDLFTSGWKTANENWDKNMADMETITRNHLSNITKEFSDFNKMSANMGKGLAALAGDSGSDGLTKGQFVNGGASTAKSSEELAAQKAAEDAAQKLHEQFAQEKASFDQQMSKQSLAIEKDRLAAGVAAGTISKQQEIDALRGFANQEYVIDDKALAAKEDLYEKGTIEYQKALDARLLLAKKHDQDLAKLDLQSVQAQESIWKGYASTVTGAMNQMLTGVLRGTQTWQQAMARLFDNLAITFIEKSIDKTVTAWITGEGLKTGATMAGDAARTASNAAATTAGLATQAVGAQKSVGMSAGQAAASVYADVAAIPYIGWLLAPPAAAAAFVAVEAFGSNFSAAGGFDIPAGVNPVTQLHQREMVLPADLAERVRGMTGGDSGGDTHIHIHAIDTQSGMDFLHQHAETIANAVHGQIRSSNPALTGMRI